MVEIIKVLGQQYSSPNNTIERLTKGQERYK